MGFYGIYLMIPRDLESFIQTVFRIRDVIPDPNFSISDPDTVSIFNSKNCFQALGNMIRDVYPRSPDLDFLHITDPGSRVQKGTGSRISAPQHCLQIPYLFKHMEKDEAVSL
jgi:hypothetical protein